MQRRVLLVEDDKRVLEILSFAIGREGYYIIRASDGQMGLQLAQDRKPDMIVLDLTHTEPNSVEMYRTLRKNGVEVPVLLFLSSEHQMGEVPEPEAKLDHIQKPFPMQELLMRIKVGLWDADTSDGSNATECLVFGRIVIYPEQILVTKDTIPLELTQREYDLLLFLAQEPGKVFSREELLTNVWGYSYLGDMRNVDVTVRRLREKIEDDPSRPAIVVTRRGRGYTFVG